MHLLAQLLLVLGEMLVLDTNSPRFRDLQTSLWNEELVTQDQIELQEPDHLLQDVLQRLSSVLKLPDLTAVLLRLVGLWLNVTGHLADIRLLVCS